MKHSQTLNRQASIKFYKYRSLTVTKNIQDYQEARMNNNTDAIEKAIHIYPELAKCQTLD